MRLLILVLSVLNLQMLWTQNAQLVFKISNDKFVLQDRYYTSGLHVTYRKKLPKVFFLKSADHEKLQINVSVGNETYTPSNLYSFDTSDFDRPYAGWLFGALELAKLKTKSALFLGFETGITGKEALSGTLQTEFHDLVNIESNPTWFQEIAFNWLFNAKASKVYEFNLGENASLQNHLKGSLGSKDTFIANELHLFFGKFNALQHSNRIGALSSRHNNEFFGFLSIGYKYVFLNALIEGSPFSNRDAFTTVAQRQVFLLKAGSVMKLRRFLFRLEYFYNTKETPESVGHAYGAFTFGFNL